MLRLKNIFYMPFAIVFIYMADAVLSLLLKMCYFFT